MQLLFMQLIVRSYMVAKNPAKTPSQKLPKNPPKIYGKNLLGLTKH
jgi:hypothetical protein